MLSLAAAFSTLPKRGQDLDLSKASSCTHQSQETVETEVEPEASDSLRLWETSNTKKSFLQPQEVKGKRRRNLQMGKY